MNFSQISELGADDSLKISNPWEANADLWIELVSNGYDLYRDHVNTPGFFSILPEVKGLNGLDLGCGEGHNTRLLAAKGALMTGIDITKKFVMQADSYNETSPQKIQYILGNATSLPFKDKTFDFATAFVSLIDISDYQKAIIEAHRILKLGGFFQFSITHPCFWHPYLEWVMDENGNKKSLICKDYFKKSEDLYEWEFDGINTNSIKERRLFKSYYFHRTLSEWINSLVEIGFQVEKLHEPKPNIESLNKYPEIDGSSIIPFFLIIRVRKT